MNSDADVAPALSGLEHEGAVDGGYNPVSRVAAAAAGFAGVVDGGGTRTCVVDAFISLVDLLLAILRTFQPPCDCLGWFATIKTSTKKKPCRTHRVSA